MCRERRVASVLVREFAGCFRTPFREQFIDQASPAESGAGIREQLLGGGAGGGPASEMHLAVFRPDVDDRSWFESELLADLDGDDDAPLGAEHGGVFLVVRGERTCGKRTAECHFVSLCHFFRPVAFYL